MKKAIPLYDEAGEQRTVWEVLKEVKDLFEEPKESYAIEISEAEINKAKFTKCELEVAEQKILWYIEKNDNDIKIHPMNSDSIAIHGEEEIWFFICRLLD